MQRFENFGGANTPHPWLRAWLYTYTVYLSVTLYYICIVGRKLMSIVVIQHEITLKTQEYVHVEDIRADNFYWLFPEHYGLSEFNGKPFVPFFWKILLKPVNGKATAAYLNYRLPTWFTKNRTNNIYL